MAQLLNSFENAVTDGSAITAGNSGNGTAGDAFDAISATGSIVADTDLFLNGARSALLTAPTAGDTAIATWNTSWAGSATVYYRICFRVNDATPTSAPVIVRFRESDDSTTGCEIRLNTSGNIDLRAPATTRYTSTTTLSADTWYRLEVKVVSSTTVGTMEARLYAGNSSTALEEFGSATGSGWAGSRDTGDGTVGGVAQGIMSTAGQASWSMSIDDVGISDVTWLGSANPAIDDSFPVAAVIGMYAGSGDAPAI